MAVEGSVMEKSVALFVLHVRGSPFPQTNWRESEREIRMVARRPTCQVFVSLSEEEQEQNPPLSHLQCLSTVNIYPRQPTSGNSVFSQPLTSTTPTLPPRGISFGAHLHLSSSHQMTGPTQGYPWQPNIVIITITHTHSKALCNGSVSDSGYQCNQRVCPYLTPDDCLFPLPLTGGLSPLLERKAENTLSRNSTFPVCAALNSSASLPISSPGGVALGAWLVWGEGDNNSNHYQS